MATVLITRPRYEGTTFCLYSWSKNLIDHANSLGIKIIDLSVDRAKKKELMSVMKKLNPGLLLLNGHGSEDFILGQNHEMLIKVGENEHILKDKIVFALACKSAKQLGPASINIGAKAYIGYTNDFIFFQTKGYETRPLTDPLARLFLEPTNQVGISLLNGLTAGEAHVKAKNKFLDNIQELISSNSKDLYIMQSLVLNYHHQVCLGDQSAKI